MIRDQWEELCRDQLQNQFRILWSGHPRNPKNGLHMFRKSLFDVIICDPPYGIRATNKIKEHRENQEDLLGLEKRHTIQDESLAGQKTKVITKLIGIDPIILALYSLAQECLFVGGRLVHLYHISTGDPYWKPVFDRNIAKEAAPQIRETIDSSYLSAHLSLSLPLGLQIEAFSQQSLSKDRLRCLVTIRKVAMSNSNII
jgi:hypothetical protein